MKRCATVGCMTEATHTLAYTFPGDRDEVVTEAVCEECGNGYVRRPALRAVLLPGIRDVAYGDYEDAREAGYLEAMRDHAEHFRRLLM